MQAFALKRLRDFDREADLTNENFIWCRGRDSNPHGGLTPLDFKSSMSTNSITSAYFCTGALEATMGFEPMNGGFANHCLRPLGHVAEIASDNQLSGRNVTLSRPGPTTFLFGGGGVLFDY